MLRAAARLIQTRPIAAASLALAVVSLVFALAPALDLSVSGLFYSASAGFLDRRTPLVEVVRQAGRLVEWAFGLTVLVPIIMKAVLPDARSFLRPRETLFVLLSFLIGPALIVNGILKAHWGRARPGQTVAFGGDALFTPAWRPSDQCLRNCSFVSGEASSAMWLLAAVFLAPHPWKRRITIAATLFAAMVSTARIAAGGHFLSDVAIAWLLTLVVMLAMKRLVLDGLPETFDARVEAALARAGTGARAALATDAARHAAFLLAAVATMSGLLFVHSAAASEAEMHEFAESVGLVLISVAVFGRAWCRRRLSAVTPERRSPRLAVGAPQLLSLVGVLGVGLQTGSFALGLLSAGLAVAVRPVAFPAAPPVPGAGGPLSALPFVRHGGRPGKAIALSGNGLACAFAEATLFLSAIPVCEGIEMLQDAGYLVPRLYLP
jgi:membrane-associated PAP2 superfamily phosphatase